MINENILYVEVKEVEHDSWYYYAWVTGKELTNGSEVRIRVRTKPIEPVVGGVYKFVLNYHVSNLELVYFPKIMRYDELSLPPFVRMLLAIPYNTVFKATLFVVALILFIWYI